MHDYMSSGQSLTLITCVEVKKLVDQLCQTNEESALIKLHETQRESVQEWLKILLKTFYSDGNRKFAERWTKFIEERCYYGKT